MPRPGPGHRPLLGHRGGHRAPLNFEFKFLNKGLFDFGEISFGESKYLSVGVNSTSFLIHVGLGVPDPVVWTTPDIVTLKGSK